MTATFSIIVPTSGRATLTRTLASITPQLEDGDEILVQRRDCHWGDEARDSAMRRAAGTHLLFIDDDDTYTADAFATIREAVAAAPDRLHVFRMRYPDGSVLWDTAEVAMGNIGSPMIVIPNTAGLLGSWGTSYEGDFHFFAETVRLRGDEPVFHDHVVALIRAAA